MIFERRIHRKDDRFGATITKGPQAIRMSEGGGLARGQEHPAGAFFKDATLRRHLEGGIEDHPMRNAAGTGRPGIEPWIIGEDGADPGQDRIDSSAFSVHEGVRSRTGDDSGCRVRCDQVAVDRLRPLGGDPGTTGGKTVSEGIVQTSDFLNATHELDLDSLGTESIDATRCDRVRIGHADDDPGDAGLDEGIHAGRRSTVMIAWLQSDPRGPVSSGIPGAGEGDDLGMGTTAAGGPTCTDPLAVGVRDDAADGRVRFRFAMGTQGEPRRRGKHRGIVEVAHSTAPVSVGWSEVEEDGAASA